MRGKTVRRSLDDDVADDRVQGEFSFEFLRGDILTVREDNEILPAAGDVQESVLVQLSEVAGVEPAVRIEGLRGLLRHLVIALHDDRSADHDLLILDLHLDVFKRASAGACALPGKSVEGNDRRRLRHAAALPELDAVFLELIHIEGVESRTADDDDL